MKKILTLFAMAMMAYTVQAAITVYVKAETAPYLWAWTSKGDIFAGWPGNQLNQKKTVQGTEFWYYTFAEDVTTVNVLFNDGGIGTNHSNVKKTGDITGITTDRYFEYDGVSTATDVTEQYGGTIPDAEINSMTLAGNNNEWGHTDFNVLIAGSKFQLVIDLTGVTIEEDFWVFKLRPNGQDWIGYDQVTANDVILENPDGLVEEDNSSGQHNFGVEMDETTGRIFTITATWAGGKAADKNWTIKFEKGNTTGISDIKTDAANSKVTPVYNLNGQRVSGSSHGVIIQNGKKVLK